MSIKTNRPVISGTKKNNRHDKLFLFILFIGILSLGCGCIKKTQGFSEDSAGLEPLNGNSRGARDASEGDIAVKARKKLELSTGQIKMMMNQLSKIKTEIKYVDGNYGPYWEMKIDFSSDLISRCISLNKSDVSSGTHIGKIKLIFQNEETLLIQKESDKLGFFRYDIIEKNIPALKKKRPKKLGKNIQLKKYKDKYRYIQNSIDNIINYKQCITGPEYSSIVFTVKTTSKIQSELDERNKISMFGGHNSKELYLLKLAFVLLDRSCHSDFACYEDEYHFILEFDPKKTGVPLIDQSLVGFNRMISSFDRKTRQYVRHSDKSMGESVHISIIPKTQQFIFTKEKIESKNTSRIRNSHLKRFLS